MSKFWSYLGIAAASLGGIYLVYFFFLKRPTASTTPQIVYVNGGGGTPVQSNGQPDWGAVINNLVDDLTL